jgi:hypothetical protein
MYFELPLMVLAVAGFATMAARSTPRLRLTFGSAAVVVALLTLGISIVDSGGRRDMSDLVDAMEATFFPGLANYQYSTVEAEPRLGSHDPATRAQAMDEWWDATLAVVRAMDDDSDGERIHFVGCGSGPQMSVNSFTLAIELDRRLRDSLSQYLRTTATPEEMEAAMQPRSGDLERVLVMIDSDAEPFPGETSIDRCAATAGELGWRTSSTIDLPDGGTARVLVHPDGG